MISLLQYLNTNLKKYHSLFILIIQFYIFQPYVWHLSLESSQTKLDLAAWMDLQKERNL